MCPKAHVVCCGQEKDPHKYILAKAAAMLKGLDHMDRFLAECLPFRLTELTPQEREENRKNGVTGGGQMDVIRSMAETAASGKRLTISYKKEETH